MGVYIRFDGDGADIAVVCLAAGCEALISASDVLRASADDRP